MLTPCAPTLSPNDGGEGKASFSLVEFRFNASESPLNDDESRFNASESRFNGDESQFNASESPFNDDESRFNASESRFNDDGQDVWAHWGATRTRQVPKRPRA